MDTPAKLKQAIIDQCGKNVAPEEIGYFNQSTKRWIHNRLDMNDVWDMVESGTKVTLWCNDSIAVNKSSHGKRAHLDAENDSNRKKQKLSSMDEKKALAEEHEQQLREKHGDKYTRFQYKLWAEMLTSGVHTDLDEPPAASMFSRTKRQKGTQSESNTNDAVVSGMMSVMNTLCQAVTSGNDKLPKSHAPPMKRAELRTVYIKQLSDLRQLCDDILDADEYEEQR